MAQLIDNDLYMLYIHEYTHGLLFVNLGQYLD